MRKSDFIASSLITALVLLANIALAQGNDTSNVETSALQQRYSNEYLSPEVTNIDFAKKYLEKAKSYDDVIHNLQQMIPTSKKISKDNIGLNFLIYDDIAIPIDILNNVMNTASNNDKNSAIYIAILTEKKRLFNASNGKSI